MKKAQKKGDTDAIQAYFLNSARSMMTVSPSHVPPIYNSHVKSAAMTYCAASELVSALYRSDAPSLARFPLFPFLSKKANTHTKKKRKEKNKLYFIHLLNNGRGREENKGSENR